MKINFHDFDLKSEIFLADVKCFQLICTQHSKWIFSFSIRSWLDVFLFSKPYFECKCFTFELFLRHESWRTIQFQRIRKKISTLSPNHSKDNFLYYHSFTNLIDFKQIFNTNDQTKYSQCIYEFNRNEPFRN